MVTQCLSEVPRLQHLIPGGDAHRQYPEVGKSEIFCIFLNAIPGPERILFWQVFSHRGVSLHRLHGLLDIIYNRYIISTQTLYKNQIKRISIIE